MENTEADAASRDYNPRTEWTLPQTEYDRIVSLLCSNCSADVDLFASYANAKCDSYISFYRDPQAMAMDALLSNWKQFRRHYIFPLFALFCKIIQSLPNQSSGDFFMVAKSSVVS